MKLLVVGSGGREHAICWKVSQNKNVEKVFCAPGNGGTATLPKGENINIKGIDELLAFAVKENIDLTIVGSEELLVDGIVDKFQEKGLKIFGPDKKAALLEGSKAYAKDFMKKYGVKTAAYEVFTCPEKAKEYIKTCEFPLVVKASGLAAGKGVLICQNLEEALKAVDEIMVDKVFSSAGEQIVVEEFLDGVEASILSVTDSKVILPFISAKDHKKIGEKETGLNTGGMGTIAPNPYVTKKVYDAFITGIMNPTLEGIKAEGMNFAGVIFFGLMINEKGVYLLEYNMRMGVLASGGYPEAYKKGYAITGIEKADNMVFVAGAKLENGELLTNGGRVLNVVAVGDNLEDARAKAYANAEKIEFKDKCYRKDIGVLYR